LPYAAVVTADDDRALRTLETLEGAVRASQTELQAILDRCAAVRGQRRDGWEWSEVVSDEERPLVVERLSRVITGLSEAGAAWRREEASLLHAEGLSMERIAALFGVTRQRISALLREHRAR